MLELQVVRLNENAKIPEKGFIIEDGVKKYTEAAGYDIFSDSIKDIVFRPFERKMLSTGIAMIIPDGFHIQFEDRSSMGAKGLKFLAGCIDNDYHGEAKVILLNTNYDKYIILTKEEPAIVEKSNMYDLKNSKFMYVKPMEETPQYYIHLNSCHVKYLKDAIIQGVPIKDPEFKPKAKEITLEEFNRLTGESIRGSNGFGSTNQTEVNKND